MLLTNTAVVLPPLPHPKPISSVEKALREHDGLKNSLRRRGVMEPNLPFLKTVPSGESAFILVHGIGESPAGMTQFSDFLNSRGHHTLSVLLDGHGIQSEALHHSSLTQWRKDVDEAIALAGTFAKDIYLGGFSLGSSLVVDAFLRNSSGLAGLYLFSPPLKPSEALHTFLLRRLANGCRYSNSRPFDPARLPYSYPFVSMTAWSNYLELTESVTQAVASLSSNVGLVAERPKPVTILASLFDWVPDWTFLDRFTRLFAADTYYIPKELQWRHVDPIRPPRGFSSLDEMLYENFMRRAGEYNRDSHCGDKIVSIR